jgi:hypothetical protein
MARNNIHSVAKQKEHSAQSTAAQLGGDWCAELLIKFYKEAYGHHIHPVGYN